MQTAFARRPRPLARHAARRGAGAHGLDSTAWGDDFTGDSTRISMEILHAQRSERHLRCAHLASAGLVLGSASPALLQQSAESLAGRIHYHELGGFALDEVGPDAAAQLWLRGGFPSTRCTTCRRVLTWRAIQR